MDYHVITKLIDVTEPNYHKKYSEFRSNLIEEIEKAGGFLTIGRPSVCVPMIENNNKLVSGEEHWCWHCSGPEDFSNNLNSSFIKLINPTGVYTV